MNYNTKNCKKKLVLAIIFFAIISIWFYRFVKINKEWPASIITQIELNKEHTINGVEYTILQSVIADPKQTLDYYEIPCENILSNKLNPMFSAGWECKVLAVQIKLKNCTDKPLPVASCFIESAESAAWSNGLSSPNLSYFNPNKAKEALEPQEELVIICPYYLYPNHFNPSVWNALEKEKFYLVSNTLYPEKLEFDCSPKFL